MYAYIDESGNTGLNNFDGSQTVLYSVAVFSKNEFDTLAMHQFNRVRTRLGVSELHANELGLARINDVSHCIRSIIKRFRVRFICAKVDKKFLAVSKLFDTLFDPFENVSVPWHVYNVEYMRIMMMLKFSLITNTELLRDFWEGCLTERSERRAREAFVRVCTGLSANVGAIPDARSREIVGQSVRWAIEHPDSITFFSQDEQNRLMNAANFVAFSIMLPEMSRLSKYYGRKVKSIVHDEQTQFDKVFNYYHGMMERAGLISLPSYFSSGGLDFRQLKDSTLHMRNSETSNALQLSDVVLYITKKAAGGVVFHGDLSRLAKCIDKKTSRYDLTFEQAEATASLNYEMLMSRDIDDSMYRRGQEFLQQIEARRIQLMQAADNPQ